MRFLETIASLDGRALHVKYHQRRVDKTLGASHLNLSEILDPPKKGYFRCRLVYDKESVKLSYHPYTLTLPKSFKIVHADTLKYHLKYEERKELHQLKADYPQFDEVIILQNMLFTDTTIANLAFLENGRWFTPKTALLEGTTRARLIDKGFLHVRDISLKDLENFQGFALMNAMIGFQIIQDGIITIRK